MAQMDGFADPWHLLERVRPDRAVKVFTQQDFRHTRLRLVVWRHLDSDSRPARAMLDAEAAIWAMQAALSSEVVALGSNSDQS
jgi:hypothetical protein